MQSMQILDKGREDAAFGGSGALNRVVITNQVRIVAVDGREKTFIVGAAAPGGDANGMGAGATRCILHHRGAGGAFYNGKPAIVEGFTICGGRTASGDNDSKYYAAGVLDAPGNEDQGRYAIWLVDCTISNCGAGAGKSFITVALNLAADSAVTVTLNGVSTTYDTAGRHEFMFDDAANPQGAFQIACTSGTADILAADVFIGMVIFFR